MPELSPAPKRQPTTGCTRSPTTRGHGTCSRCPRYGRGRWAARRHRSASCNPSPDGRAFSSGRGRGIGSPPRPACSARKTECARRHGDPAPDDPHQAHDARRPPRPRPAPHLGTKLPANVAALAAYRDQLTGSRRRVRPRASGFALRPRVSPSRIRDAWIIDSSDSPLCRRPAELVSRVATSFHVMTACRCRDGERALP